MRRWVLYLGIIIALLASVTGFFVYYLYDTSRELSEHIYEPLSITQPTVNSDVQEDGDDDAGQPILGLLTEMEQSSEQQVQQYKSFTVLIMGVDQRSGDKGRSDVIIVASVNPNESSTIMMNIPRDTRTTIAGLDSADKVNHSYAYGGTAMTVATIEQFIGVPINYYIKVDMEGFQKIIDIVGGIEVNNSFAFQYEGHNFKKGNLELHGKEALAYVRMRYDDPEGDLGRNERQKQVIKAVLNHLLSIKNMFKLSKIVKSVEEHAKTNLTFDEWKTVGLEYREALEHVETELISGHGQIIDGIYYFIVLDKERERIKELFRLHQQ